MGNSYVEKLFFNEERPDLIENPFLEFLNNKKPWNDAQFERANLISAYYLNINKRYDLDVKYHYLFKELSPIQEYNNLGFL